MVKGKIALSNIIATQIEKSIYSNRKFSTFGLVKNY